MDQKLKERLLGAIVILSALIIFLPMLFKQDNKAPSELTQESRRQVYKIESGTKVAALEQELETLVLEKEILIKAESKPELKPAVLPAPVSVVAAVSAPVPVAAPITAAAQTKTWVVRMGIFGNPTNAKLLVENLRSKGYQAYSKVDTSKGAKLTRVFVGPKMNKAEIKKIQKEIKTSLNIQGIILLVPEQETVQERG